MTRGVLDGLKFAFMAACFLLASPPLTVSQAGSKIGAVRIRGLARFKEAQLLPMLQVFSGAPFSQPALDAATEALGKSGAFEEVRYSYRLENGAVTVEFFVKETAKFRRCVFDNFPFAGPAELISYAQRRVPLFDGSAPDFGSMLDEVDSALADFAKSRGIQATVEHTRYTRLGSSELEYLFRLRGPSIKISAVHFGGNRAIAEAALLGQARPLLGRDFSVVDCREFAANVFLPYYTEHGFLKAKLADAAAKVLDPRGSADSFRIEVTYQVTEGAAYRWDGAEWRGNQALEADHLDSLLELKSGDAANSKKIEESWEAVAREYGKRGYIRMRLRPVPAFDDAAGRVRFHAELAEGDQFRMGVFTAQGFPEAAAKKLQSRWKLKPGDIFDASYANEFTQKEAGAFLPRSGQKQPKIALVATPDQTQRTVSVVLRLDDVS